MKGEKVKSRVQRPLVLFIAAALLLNCFTGVPMLLARATVAEAVLTGSNVPFTGGVDLTSEGTEDWAHWGGGFDRKSSGTLIPDITVTGQAASNMALNDSQIRYKWTDGSPTVASDDNGSGRYSGNGADNIGGFQVTIPLDTAARTVNVYCSAYGTRGQFKASLSDGTEYTTDADTNGAQNGYYKIGLKIQPKELSTLTITFATGYLYSAQWGNVSLQAITVAQTVSLCDGTNESFTGNVDLTEEGALDWTHWGPETDRKKGAGLISDIGVIGNASNDKYLNDSKITYTWTDGTPSEKQSGNASGKHTGDAKTGGLFFTVPADKDTKILNVYGSVWGAAGTFYATLDDGATYTTAVDSKGVRNEYYHIRIIYNSAQGQNLTIKFLTDKFYDTQWGNISIHAATLLPITQPIIFLNGEKDIKLNKNTPFTDPFVKAYDKTGDITRKVTMTGEADTTKYGVYTIRYDAENEGLTAATVTRTVTVAPDTLTVEPVRESDGSKTVRVTGAVPGATIRLYDNTMQCVKEALAAADGSAVFKNLTSICYRATQAVDGTENQMSDKACFEPDLNDVPEVVLDEHPEWVTLYNTAWQLHKNNTKESASGSGLTDYYVDENFDNDNIYQWDVLFMALFNVYGYSEFPGIDTLDDFYRYQEDNGFICRVIKEDGGGNGYGFTSSSFNAVNPPLFAYVEWKYYEISGDSSRFSKKINGLTVLERLEKLFYFIKNTRTYSDGTYMTNGQANGMDNTPGYDVSNLSWVDLASQQAQSAYYISKIAETVGDSAAKAKFDAEYAALKNIINEKHWDSADSFYYNIDEANGSFYKSQRQRTPMGWWPMAANIPTPGQSKDLVTKYIMNPDEFWRPMGISTVSRQSTFYDNSGNYWNGGVWAPTEYMTNIALKNYGYYDEAAQNAIHYINGLNAVFTEDDKPFTVYTNSGRKVYDVTNQYSKTLWEMYQPEYIQPGGIEDYNASGDIGLVRKDFVGWTGLAPIAMMIEDVLGFTADAPENTLEWRLNLAERNGIENFRFNDNLVSLIAGKRSNSNEKAAITVSARKAFHLKVCIGGKWYERDIPAGSSSFELGEGAATDAPALEVSKSDPASHSAIDLTAEGALDWIQCGTGANKIDRKNTGTKFISDWRTVGKTDTVKFLPSGDYRFDWSDGKTNRSGTDISSNVANYRSGQGFEFTVPADLTERVLNVYVGGYAVDAKLDVEISDGSSTSYIDRLDPGGKSDYGSVYSIHYRASRENQFLTVRYTAAGKEYDGADGRVSLYAATLSLGKTEPVAASVQSGTVLPGTEVKLSTPTSGAKIRYSLDGGTTWKDYMFPVILTSLPASLTTYAVKDGYESSEIHAYSFTDATVIPGISSVSASNGNIVVQFDKIPTNPPKASDFQVFMSIDGGEAAALNIRDFVYDPDANAVTVHFDSIEPSSRTQSVVVTVKYINSTKEAPAFAVDAIPSETTRLIETTRTSGQTAPGGSETTQSRDPIANPQMGDHAPIAFMLVLAAGSFGSIVACSSRKRSLNKNKRR